MKTKKKNHIEGVPSLNKLAGEWISKDKLAHFPTVHNYHGALQVNRDLASVSWLVNVPFSQGYHTGALYIDDKICKTDEFKWYPYQAKRRTKINGLKIVSSTRMVFEDKGVLIRINLSNNTGKTISLKLKKDLLGVISKFKSPLDWDWFYRLPGYPEDNGSRNVPFNAIKDTESSRTNLDSINNKDLKFESEINNASCFITKDLDSNLFTVFSFSVKPDNIKKYNGYTAEALWNIKLVPGESKSLGLIMSFGSEHDNPVAKAVKWADKFDTSFNMCKLLWQKRFNDAFTPNNGHFSGSLPVLSTNDKKLAKMYYMGIVTLLMLHRTNLPVMERAYLTGGPRLGATIMFCWDTSMWSTVFALLDPVMMKKFINNMLRLDIDSYFGQDMLGGRGVGNMYSATRMNIFKMIYTYVCVAGDEEFLNEKIFSLFAGTYAEMQGEEEGALDENIGEITILQEMENLATVWKKQVREGSPLADYGEAINLLECVPTYIHRVPSFNAANVWMMRLTAELYDLSGNFEKAELLNKEADYLAKAVLELYIPGEGVWSSLHRDGKKVEMRHCFDFISIGKFMTNDLTDEMKNEMMNFVESELLTATWMRAQSLKDPAAKSSDRADHGPLGAYDGWPAQIADVMGIFGNPQKAVNYVKACEDVTKEGNFSQARELYGPNKFNFDADVRIADRDLVNRECSGGVAFANTVIQTVFGIQPKMGELKSILLKPNMRRNLEGTLKNLLYNGKYYNIISNNNGLNIFEK